MHLDVDAQRRANWHDRRGGAAPDRCAHRAGDGARTGRRRGGLSHDRSCRARTRRRRRVPCRAIPRRRCRPGLPRAPPDPAGADRHDPPRPRRRGDVADVGGDRRDRGPVGPHEGSGARPPAGGPARRRRRHPRGRRRASAPGVDRLVLPVRTAGGRPPRRRRAPRRSGAATRRPWSSTPMPESGCSPPAPQRPTSYVVAIETSRSAVADAEENLSARRHEIVRGEVGGWRAPADLGAEVVIADPARSGLGAPGTCRPRPTRRSRARARQLRPGLARP